MSEPSKKRLPFRWLSLAELVGIVALGIAGLSYWDTHRERTQEAGERAAAAKAQQAEARAGVLKQTFLMTGAPDSDGDKIRLATVHPDQVIQTQTVWFPSAIRADSVETTGNPRLDAVWIEGGLHKALSAAGGTAKQGRMPVGVLTVFIEDGETKTDRAVYQLGYSLHPRMLRSDKLELEGLSLARRGVAGELQKAADTLWTAR